MYILETTNFRRRAFMDLAAPVAGRSKAPTRLYGFMTWLKRPRSSETRAPECQQLFSNFPRQPKCEASSLQHSTLYRPNFVAPYGSMMRLISSDFNLWCFWLLLCTTAAKKLKSEICTTRVGTQRFAPNHHAISWLLCAPLPPRAAAADVLLVSWRTPQKAPLASGQRPHLQSSCSSSASARVLSTVQTAAAKLKTCSYKHALRTSFSTTRLRIPGANMSQELIR